MLRVVQFAGQLRARAGSSAPSLHRLFAGKANDHSDLDDDVYELLPPGASMKDPLYGLSPDQKVHSPVGKKVVSDKHAAPTVPLSREAARAKLEEQRKAGKEDEDELYVYLPPGSSMREPGDSMSDPADKKIHRVDPVPSDKA